MSAGYRCPRCDERKPADEFPLRDDPEQRARRYATRLWCAACLVARGHLTRAGLDAARRRAAARFAALERDRRLARLERQLVDKAAGDDVFAAALRRAVAELPEPAGPWTRNGRRRGRPHKVTGRLAS